MKKILNKLFVILAVFMLINSCQEPEFVEVTSFDKLIGEYLEETPEFSEFTKILELTGNMSFLKAYGTYTCFAPTNQAIQDYLTKKQVGEVSQIPLEELNDLVKYHVILDTLSTADFFDGKLRTATMYGQYLLVSTSFDGEEAKSLINKYSEILQPDLRQSNGIVHSIATVLEPVTKSIAELLEEQEEFSIFVQALKETGYYDLLNTVTPKEEKEKHWYTVFAQTNESLQSEGINSYEDLKAKYSSTGDPSQKMDSLNLYIAYHILDNQLLYLGDLVLFQAQETLAPQEVVTIRLNSDSVMLNEDYFNDILEKGVYLIRDESDRTSANGVFHILNSNLFIKVRFPFPVYFEVTDQPELRKLVGQYRTIGSRVTLTNDQLDGVSWYGDNTILYVVDNGGSDLPIGSLVHNDYFQITLRTAVIRWIEFKTPLLVKGTYKVWICTRNVYYRRAMYTVTFNDQVLPNIIDNNFLLPNNPLPSDAELLALGYKRYNWVPVDSASYYCDRGGRLVSQLAGTIEVPTTGNHTIRFDVINNEMNGTWVDMIQFIPVDMDQVWPRISAEGELFYDYPEGYVVNQ